MMNEPTPRQVTKDLVKTTLYGLVFIILTVLIPLWLFGPQYLVLLGGTFLILVFCWFIGVFIRLFLGHKML